MLHRLTLAFLVFASRVVLVVAQRPSLKARRNVSACCPNNGQWVAAGRGSARRLFQPSNFFIKRGTVLFVSDYQATTVYVFNRGYGLLGYISFLAAVIVVFFASQACPTKKNCVAFCRRRRPDGICLPTFIFFALPLDVAQPAAPINAAYLAFMLIVSIS